MGQAEEVGLVPFPSFLFHGGDSKGHLSVVNILNTEICLRVCFSVELKLWHGCSFCFYSKSPICKQVLFLEHIHKSDDINLGTQLANTTGYIVLYYNRFIILYTQIIL